MFTDKTLKWKGEKYKVSDFLYMLIWKELKNSSYQLQESINFLDVLKTLNLNI